MIKVKVLLQNDKTNKLQTFVSDTLNDLLGKAADQNLIDNLVQVCEELDIQDSFISEDETIKKIEAFINPQLSKIKNSTDVNEISGILAKLNIQDDQNKTIANAAINANNQRIAKEKAEAEKKAKEAQIKLQLDKLKSIAAFQQYIGANEDPITKNGKLPHQDFDTHFNKLSSDNFDDIYAAAIELGIPKDNGDFILASLKASLRQHTLIINIIDNIQDLAVTIDGKISNNNNNTIDIKQLGSDLIAGLSSTDQDEVSNTLHGLGLTKVNADNLVTDQVIAENKYFYLIKKASIGHPHLKNLLAKTPTVKDALKALTDDINVTFKKLIFVTPQSTPKQLISHQEYLKKLSLPDQGQDYEELKNENAEYAKITKSKTSLEDMKQLAKDLNIGDDNHHTGVKKQYAKNQLNYIQHKLKLTPTLLTIFEDQTKFDALKNFIITKTHNEIKMLVTDLSSTDANKITSASSQNGFNLGFDADTIKQIRKENLAVKQHERIISEISKLDDLMEDEAIQKDFVKALMSKSPNEIDEFIKTVKSNDTPIDIIHQHLHSFNLENQNDKKLSTDIYADNQFNYLIKQTPPNSTHRKEFNDKKREIQNRLKDINKPILSPQEIKAAFTKITNAVDQTNIKEGFDTLGVQNPSSEILQANVDVLAHERMKLYAESQSLAKQKTELMSQKIQIQAELAKNDPAKLQLLNNQLTKLNQDLDKISNQHSDIEKKLAVKRIKENTFLINKFVNEKFNQKDDAKNTYFQQLNLVTKGDRSANRFEKTILLANRYCIDAEKAALTIAKPASQSKGIYDSKTELQLHIASCKRAKAELMAYHKWLKDDSLTDKKYQTKEVTDPKTGRADILENIITKLSDTIDTYEPAIKTSLEKVLHFSTNSEVFTDMDALKNKIEELLKSSGQVNIVGNGTITTDTSVASHFNTSDTFHQKTRLNTLTEMVGDKEINLLDTQQVANGVYKTTAYFNLQDFHQCNKDQKLRYAITLIENHRAGDPSSHGKFKASANFPQELIVLMAIYCKKEGIEFVPPPIKPNSGVSKIFSSSNPFKITQKQIDEMQKRIDRKPDYFSSSEEVKALAIRREDIKKMQTETGQTEADIEKFSSVRLGG